MTYERKKQNVAGRVITAADLKILKRICSKYGAASFDAACHKIKTLPERRAGREKHYIGNLASVLIAVDEVAKDAGGLERAFDLLSEKVPSLSGKNYKRAGLKSLYHAAAALLKTDSKFAHMVGQFREARAHPERAFVIGDPIPSGLTRGPTIPLMMKIRSE
jgi:hypothetical protein